MDGIMDNDEGAIDGCVVDGEDDEAMDGWEDNALDGLGVCRLVVAAVDGFAEGA